MDNLFFILYGIKDNQIYYISNTNPVIWSPEIENSKLYFSRYSAEFDILRDYDNYKSVSSLINNSKLDALYVASIVNYKEKERFKIL